MVYVASVCNCAMTFTSRDVARMLTEASDSDCCSLSEDEEGFTSLESESGKFVVE